MLSRGFYDALAIWPTAFWPIVFSSSFWAFLRLYLGGQGYGTLALSTQRGATALFWTFVPLGALFEAAIHLYLLWTIGAVYLLVALPIYLFGWTVLPALLDDFGPAVALLPMVHVGFAAAFLVLAGFIDIGPLRALNAEIYGLLTGVPVVL